MFCSGLLREDRRKWREEISSTVPTLEDLQGKQMQHNQWIHQAAVLTLVNTMLQTDVVGIRITDLSETNLLTQWWQTDVVGIRITDLSEANLLTQCCKLMW